MAQWLRIHLSSEGQGGGKAGDSIPIPGWETKTTGTAGQLSLCAAVAEPMYSGA